MVLYIFNFIIYILSLKYYWFGEMWEWSTYTLKLINKRAFWCSLSLMKHNEFSILIIPFHGKININTIVI